MDTKLTSPGALIRVARDARIVGGYPALLGEFPHQVAITYNDDFVCGGSIIGKFLVLTAAHCVISSLFPRTFHFKVIAGLQNMTDEGVSEQMRRVRSIETHQKFNRRTFENDIALMYLSEPFVFNTFIRSIKLPEKNEVFYGYATVSGWGAMKYRGYGSVQLRKVTVPLVPLSVCRNKYQGIYNITDDMICMGGRGADSCQGDSGGAAICKGLDSTVVQCGVVSFGHGCALNDIPGVYTAVSHYVDWIGLHIGLSGIMAPWKDDKNSKEIIDPGCLKAGTKILMADGSERNVEHLKIGDLLLDMELRPTKLIGLNYQYLMRSHFYGFDNQSYFFTGEHMFVGKGNNSTEHQYYVKSLPSLLENNPLMKYWDVKEMGETFGIFRYNWSLKSVHASSVEVFKDMKTYPLDTPVYFLQVDNPSGTYFANGFVCKVDVPPIDKWPNTMGLLFNIMRSSSFETLTSSTYSLSTINSVDLIISKLTKEVSIYLRSDEFRKESNTTLMTLDNANVDECISKIFNEPTSALLSIKLYSKLGLLLSSILDAGQSEGSSEKTAKLQHGLYNTISSRLMNY